MNLKELIETALEGAGLKKDLPLDGLLLEQKKMVAKMRKDRNDFNGTKNDGLEEILNNDSVVSEDTNFVQELFIDKIILEQKEMYEGEREKKNNMIDSKPKLPINTVNKLKRSFELSYKQHINTLVDDNYYDFDLNIQCIDIMIELSYSINEINTSDGLHKILEILERIRTDYLKKEIELNRILIQNDYIDFPQIPKIKIRESKGGEDDLATLGEYARDYLRLKKDPLFIAKENAICVDEIIRWIDKKIRAIELIIKKEVNEKKRIKLSEDNIYTQLLNHLETENIEEFVNHLNSNLASIPYTIRKKTEGYVQSNVHSSLIAIGFRPISEFTTNKGRIDIYLETNSHIFIIELKINSNAKNALKQIKDKEYYQPFLTSPKKIICIGLSFNTNKNTIDSYDTKSIQDLSLL